MYFTVEEENLICMYHNADRRRTMGKITAVLPDMDGDMRVLAQQPLSKLAEPVTIYPQVLKNVIVDDKDGTMADAAVQASVKAVEARLGGSGRVLLRKSGTEPLLRVMAEAETDEVCEAAVDEIIDAMRESGHLVRVK